jgi:hypothetical protein
MRTLTVPLLAAGFLLIGCDAPTPMPTALKAPTALRAFGNGNGIQHRVSLGSHDFAILKPGTDANDSFIAIQHADGSVTGQWTDQFGHGNGGLHIVVDCLAVTGNQAWISGIATKAFDEALVGTRWATRVVDNGTSANDPPDQMSFSIGPFPPAFDCHTRLNFPLFDVGGGEVKVD